ncbi:hypothetical protein E1178_15070 [Roseibium hamelinense]|uniref:hypothetical protein n=1 Tax=Roseibium hamelinense TaxID=150831 RepID=UPI0011A60E52|nr:hypothetical protein [Roseibium hamelinense]MTI44932.1 hypothetical protein [Roseibium hamelinense]
MAQLYLYWIVRLCIEGIMFAGMLELCILNHWLARNRWAAVVAAAFASFVPFALAITALDIVIGIPELGMNTFGGTGPAAHGSRLSAFLLELGYLVDNHLVLCALMGLPLLWSWDLNRRTQLEPDSPQSLRSSAEPLDNISKPINGYLARLTPPITVPLIRAEAQEHYVKLVTA